MPKFASGSVVMRLLHRRRVAPAQDDVECVAKRPFRLGRRQVEAQGFLDCQNVLETLGKRNITEFNYRADSKKSPDSMEPASIFVGIALKEGDKERKTIRTQLAADGYTAHDLTDDDIAKSHIKNTTFIQSNI